LKIELGKREITEQGQLFLEEDGIHSVHVLLGSVFEARRVFSPRRYAFAQLSKRFLCSANFQCANPSCSKISTPFDLIFNFDGRLVYFLATNPSSNLKRKNERKREGTMHYSDSDPF
jgi:hypothetical protein